MAACAGGVDLSTRTLDRNPSSSVDCSSQSSGSLKPSLSSLSSLSPPARDSPMTENESSSELRAPAEAVRTAVVAEAERRSQAGGEGATVNMGADDCESCRREGSL